MTSWDRVAAWATTLAHTTVETWYGTPALKVAGKGFARFRANDEGALVVMCTLDRKRELLAQPGTTFFTTPHYDGYGAILVDLDQITLRELRPLLLEARLLEAPAKLVRAGEI